AFELRLGTAQRVNLPPKVIALLETLVDGLGDYINFDSLRLQILPPLKTQGQATPEQHLELEESFLAIKGQTFHNPSRYGRRLGQESKEKLPVHAIALDDRIAWSDLPLRVLDSVERVQYQAPPKAIVALIGDFVMIVPDPAALDARIKA